MCEEKENLDIEKEETSSQSINEGENAEIDENVEKGEQPVVEEKPAEPSLEEQLAVANDRFLRSRAEFDNYRKRMAREAMETRELAKCDTIREFLDVYDYFQMALQQAESGADPKTILEGIKMIAAQMTRTLDNLGVKAVDVTGEEFDPRYHEAVSQESSDDVPEGKIIREWKCMFKLGERLIRAATVVVSSGPEKSSGENKEKEE